MDTQQYVDRRTRIDDELDRIGDLLSDASDALYDVEPVAIDATEQHRECHALIGENKCAELLAQATRRLQGIARFARDTVDSTYPTQAFKEISAATPATGVNTSDAPSRSILDDLVDGMLMSKSVVGH